MSIKVVRTRQAQDNENIYRFLYEVWVDGRKDDPAPGTDHKKRQIRDELDDWARHCAAIDESERIVGCIRLNVLSEGKPDAELATQMEFAKLSDLFGPAKVSYTSQMAVEPAERGSTVASLLNAAVMRIHLREEILLNTICCPLHLVPLYFSLGYRPYAPKFRVSTGYRVPLILCVHDIGYLQHIESPLLSIFADENDDRGAAAETLNLRFAEFTQPGFERSAARAVWARLAHSTPQDSDIPEVPLFAELTPDELSSALHHVTRLDFLPNDVLFRLGETEEGMGVLMSGSLGVSLAEDTQAPHFIAVIKPGEIFGEMQAFGAGVRTANVIALEASQVMILQNDLLQALGKREPETAMKIAHNILRTFTSRLRTSNKLVASLSGGKRNALRVQRQASQKSFDEAELLARLQGFGLDAFLGEETDRFEADLNAVLFERVEFDCLCDLGLSDQTNVLTLGSTPLITTRLLGEHFAQGSLIGVEPDSIMAKKASAHFLRQNAKHCRLVPGAFDRIPLDNGATDFAYARFPFERIPEYRRSLLELKRVVRPGGVVAISDLDDVTLAVHPDLPRSETYGDKFAQALSKFGGDGHVGRKLSRFMREAGFAHIHVEAIPVTTEILGPAEFCRLAFGYQRSLLMHAKLWSADEAAYHEQIAKHIEKTNAFGSLVLYIAHAVVPE